MRKIFVSVLAFLFVCGAVACTAYEKAPTTPENDIVDVTESAEKSEDEKESENATDNQTQDGLIAENLPVSEILDVNKNSFYYNEMHEDCPEFLVKSKFSSLVLTEECATEYPALAEALKTRSVMQTKAMTEEFDNFVADSRERADVYGLDSWKTYVTKLDSQIRRADSVAFSYLSDTYTDTPHIENFRSFYGTSFDSQTGKELLVTDVVKDMKALPDILKKEITSHMWTGEFNDENAIRDYLESTLPSDISWVLDYNGVTFFFYPGSIANENYGIITATVAFAEHPEIFEKKYMASPESYAVKIPVTSSFFADLDNDGALDELVFTAHKDELFGNYTDAYIVTSDSFYEEEFLAYAYNAYYIKTEEGRHLLYVFGESEEDFNRVMGLRVYDVTDGVTKRVGAKPFAQHHSVNEDSADVFALPVNPKKMHFDFFTEEPDFRYPVFSDTYKVGKNLMPVKTDDSEQISPVPQFAPESLSEIEFDEAAIAGTGWQGYVLVDQQSGMPEYCSTDINDDLFVELELFNDGRGIIRYEGSYSDFNWGCDTSSSAYLNLGEAGNRYFFVYKDASVEDSPLWIMMQMNEKILWLYKK